MQRVLGLFHHRVSLRLTGWQLCKVWDGGWFYFLLEDAMAEAGMKEVETYVSCRQSTMAQYIATRPIMDLCMVAKRRPGPRVTMRWWVQKGVDFKGMRVAAWEA